MSDAGACGIQNDPADTAYPVDVIASNRLWLVHHCHGGPPPGPGVDAPWGTAGVHQQKCSSPDLSPRPPPGVVAMHWRAELRLNQAQTACPQVLRPVGRVIFR